MQVRMLWALFFCILLCLPCSFSTSETHSTHTPSDTSFHSLLSSCIHYAYLFAIWVSFLRGICLKNFVLIKGFVNIQKPMGGSFLLRNPLTGRTLSPFYPQDIPDFCNTHQEPKYFPSLLVNQRILEITHS